jgi:hypothetical protein
MCASPPEVEFRTLSTIPNYEQSDHIWMIKNARDAYMKRLGLVTSLLVTQEPIESVIEFNPGNIGIFGNLLMNEELKANIKNYRHFDGHYDCHTEVYTNNKDNKGKAPQVSFSSHVGNIWEYEDIIPPRNRYKSTVVIVHYLSAVPDESIAGAIYQICRLTSRDVIIIDYPPEQCKIDIPRVFASDLSESSVTTNDFVFPAKAFSETIYHLKKAPTS